MNPKLLLCYGAVWALVAFCGWAICAVGGMADDAMPYPVDYVGDIGPLELRTVIDTEACDPRTIKLTVGWLDDERIGYK